MECKQKECKQKINAKNCKCTNIGCSRRGLCCECIRKHLAKRELPGCCFSGEAEKTYSRSFEHFAKLIQEKKF